MEDFDIDDNSQPSDLAAARAIDRICDDWEEAWVTDGNSADLEVYLARLPDAEHRPDLLFQLLKVEFEYQGKQQPVAIDAYLTRFPQETEIVERAYTEVVSRASNDETVVRRSFEETTSHRDHSLFPYAEVDRDFGSYALLAEIARGGMGIVYRAQQKGADRQVALKVIRSGKLADSEERKRFATEARAAAGLRHVHIVQVYEVGEFQGQPYFSMELIEGPSLAERIKLGPLDAREAVNLVQKIATAVEFAHRHNVIHRDIKPANILITPAGDPMITDFGLAKAIHLDSQLTATGQILGTPSYMSPEQASSDHVDHRSDVYAIGATLYCLLTGRPPFQASTVVETMAQVCNVDPIPPSTLNRELDRDLNTICLKCLQKEPSKRYASAIELADELQRWVNHEPIVARPIGIAERVVKWCQKEPVTAALGAIIFATLVVGISVTSALAIFANAKSNDATTQKRKYERQASESERQRDLVALEKSQVEQQKLIVEIERDKLRQQRDRAERLVYFNDIQTADRYWEDGDAERALGLLDESQPRLRHWEYRYLRTKFAPGQDSRSPREDAIFPRINGAAHHLAISPSGRYLVTWNDTRAYCFDTISRETILQFERNDVDDSGAATGKLAFHPKHDYLFHTNGNTIQVRQLGDHDTDSTIRPFPGSGIDGHAVADFAVAAVPRLLIASRQDGEVGVLNLATQREVFSESTGQRDSPPVVAIEDSGRFFAYSVNSALVIVSIADGSTTVAPSSSTISSLQFSPDGRHLVTGSTDGSMRVWLADSGRVVRHLIGHQQDVTSLLFSADGQRLFSLEPRRIIVWDWLSGRTILELNHSVMMEALALHPDGTRLFAATTSGTIECWDASGDNPKHRSEFFGQGENLEIETRKYRMNLGEIMGDWEAALFHADQWIVRFPDDAAGGAQKRALLNRMERAGNSR